MLSLGDVLQPAELDLLVSRLLLVSVDSVIFIVRLGHQIHGQLLVAQVWHRFGAVVSRRLLGGQRQVIEVVGIDLHHPAPRQRAIAVDVLAEAFTRLVNKKLVVGVRASPLVDGRGCLVVPCSLLSGSHLLLGVLLSPLVAHSPHVFSGLVRRVGRVPRYFSHD